MRHHRLIGAIGHVVHLLAALVDHRIAERDRLPAVLALAAFHEIVQAASGRRSGNTCEAEIGTAQPPNPPHLLSLGAEYSFWGGRPQPPPTPTPAPPRTTTAEPQLPPPPTGWTKPQPPWAWQRLEPRQVWKISTAAQALSPAPSRSRPWHE
jgi:hypothetical protein